MKKIILKENNKLFFKYLVIFYYFPKHLQYSIHIINLHYFLQCYN